MHIFPSRTRLPPGSLCRSMPSHSRSHHLTLSPCPSHCPAQLRVVAPSLRVTAIVGQDVVLCCQLSPCKDVRSSDIRWIQQQSSGLVHHYQDGVDLEKMEKYKGRTELLRDGLSDGNLDLRITAVRSSDSGSYSCVVQDDDGYAEAVVNLEVSDPFSQIVHPWKVALAVVVTLLVGSFVITAFLYRKKVVLNRKLKRKDSMLAAQARMFGGRKAELEKQIAELVKQNEKSEKRNSLLKEQNEKMERWEAKLDKLAVKLVELTEALESSKESN